MGSWVTGVVCPTCMKALYTLEREDGQTDWRHRGERVREDALGHYVRCSGCKTRVALRLSTQHPGFGFEVAR